MLPDTEAGVTKMNKETTCGFWNFRPAFLQRFATPRCFMIVYGLLGTAQAMAFIYFVVSLTTMERRFKIPSQTTGIMLSGNEISQILLSLFLSYFGGQRNRPRWIAWGVLFCSLSCFILALPHFLYGPGDEALALTKEYSDFYQNASSRSIGGKALMCSADRREEDCDDDSFLLSNSSLLPVILVFLSQFVLGIGNTLYYSLGNTYMDDNTKKTNTPMLLGYACALRTLGPAFGFVLGPLCLSLYIDPSLTPLITKDDTRWMGAWWLGWIILGFVMFLFSFLVGIFPKKLPKVSKNKVSPESGIPQYPKFTPAITEKTLKDELPLAKNPFSPDGSQVPQEAVLEHNSNIGGAVLAQTDHKDFPTMKEFSGALTRLLRNKILMANILAGVFYILGASAYMTYMAKYIEIQFSRPSAMSTIIVGPAVLVGMIAGFLLSGWYISKKKPLPRKLLAWNIVVGFAYLIGEFSYMFLSCPMTSIEQQIAESGRSLLMTECNNNCMCDRVKYEPVCHQPTGKLYFSPCHAGCTAQLPHSLVYTNCSCIPTYSFVNTSKSLHLSSTPTTDDWSKLIAGSCSTECAFGYYMFAIIAMFTNVLGSSGKIGNILVNYRSVEVRDKSFAQGLLLLLISLCALIPGPIIYGAIIDSTCIEWGEECGQQTNCLMYNKDKYRIYINAAAFGFTLVGVFLDGVVWYLSKDLDLYGDSNEDNKTLDSSVITTTKSEDGKPIEKDVTM